MVLSRGTDCILIGDPLNNLDIAHSVETVKHLQSVAGEVGRTIIVVLHGINFADRYAARCKAGQIIGFGTPREIVQDNLLTDTFNTPVRVLDGPHCLVTVHQ